MIDLTQLQKIKAEGCANPKWNLELLKTVPFESIRLKRVSHNSHGMGEFQIGAKNAHVHPQTN